MIIKYEWTALLDSSTCEDCADLDGTIFDKEDLPDFPQHVNCQCELIPDVGEIDD